MNTTRNCAAPRVSVASRTVSGRLEAEVVFSHGRGRRGDTDTCLGKLRAGESPNCEKTTHCTRKLSLRQCSFDSFDRITIAITKPPCRTLCLRLQYENRLNVSRFGRRSQFPEPSHIRDSDLTRRRSIIRNSASSPRVTPEPNTSPQTR